MIFWTRLMFDFIPKWSTLRGAGNSRFSRLTVLTPVFGYLILYLDFFRTIPILSSRYAEAPANFRDSMPIYLIYFGLCLFSVGVVIYQMLCSEIVKRYDDHIAYVLAVAGNISQFECEHILQRIIASKFTSEGARSRADLVLKSISLSPDLSRENRVFALTEHYNMLNIDNYVGRVISSALLAIGAILIAFPTLKTFWSIVGSLWR